ncbi:Phage tail sheath protein [Methylomagnum ishizawai]|uniref:Phage tail sheath protein n=1 Tax=Methylomagnum ishizawai TaxID=1760988 RepID=A0A1Y6CZD5_9GAMM|nr:hypothetical protein [Methylomagnum ishizawai]SMF93933.1 Phage tail sheath protein [Methylomagnum ishizawai]
MAFFFDGQLYITPAVVSRIDDTALANRNLTVGNVLAILGSAPALEPKTAYRFGGPQDAIDAGVDGEALVAVTACFDPSPETGAPATIVFVSPAPSTQAALTLLDAGSGNAIALTATRYGLGGNADKVKVESGTHKGKKITTQVGTRYYTQDDIHRDALSVQYHGVMADARLSVTNTQVTLEAPVGTAVATIGLNDFGTVQALADRISVTPGWLATVLDGNEDKPALNGLDALANQALASATVANVQFTGGAASAAITITATQIVLEAPTGTAVATLDLVTDNPTIADVVAAIDGLGGWTASVSGSLGAFTAAYQLRTTLQHDVKTSAYAIVGFTPVTVTGDLQACVDWFNSGSEGFVNARRAGALPPANQDWTYLAGGSDGSTTVQDWTAAFTALQAEDVQWVAPLSSNPAVWDMADAHCAYMSKVARSERRNFVGTATGTTDAAAIAAAKALNSDRTALVHLGAYLYNANGALTLYPAYVAAAMIAAGFAGQNPGQAMTNRALNVEGVERKLRVPTDTDPLIRGGVIPLENRPTGYFVCKSISAWLINDNYDKVEISVGAGYDFLARNLREALQPIVGRTGSPFRMADARTRCAAVLDELSKPEPNGIGLLVGDAENPPWKNLRLDLSGDVLAIQVDAAVGIPINYITIVVHARAYSGTLAA